MEHAHQAACVPSASLARERNIDFDPSLHRTADMQCARGDAPPLYATARYGSRCHSTWHTYERVTAYGTHIIYAGKLPI